MKNRTLCSFIFCILVQASTVAAWQEALYLKEFRAGVASQKAGRLEDAEGHYRKALKAAEDFGDDKRLAGTAHNLAIVCMLRGNYPEAEKFFIRSRQIQEKLNGIESREVAFEIDSLAKLYINADRLDAAETLLNQGLAIGEKVLGPEHLLVGKLVRSLGEVKIKQKKYAAAEPLYKRALIMFEKSLGQDHWTVEDILEEYSVVLKKLNRQDEAKEMQLRAKQIRAKKLPHTPYEVPR